MVHLHSIVKLIFFLVAYGVLFYTLWQASNSLSAKAWPKVKGVIINSGIEDGGDIEASFYSPVIKYKYTVNSKEYISEKISFGTLGAGNKFLSKHIINKFEGKSYVEVSYNPSRPTEAVILTGINHYQVLNICFVVVFIYLLHSKFIM